MFNRTAHVSANVVARRGPQPAMVLLPLPQAVTQQPYRRAATLPQSPLQETVMVGQPLVLPFTPTATAQVTTPVQLSPGLQLQQQIDGLTKGINTKLPSDMVYPSLGQVGEEAQRVSTFLDLYQSRARDDETLSKVKSPTSREEGAWWVTLDAVVEPIQPKRRNPELRHNRLALDIMKPLPVIPDSELQVGAKTNDDDDVALAQPAETTTTTLINDPPLTVDLRHRQKTIEQATSTIVNADARRMLEFRKRFRNRPPQLHLPSQSILSSSPQSASSSLPSPPLPSALLKIKSPTPLPPPRHHRRLPHPPPPRLPQLPKISPLIITVAHTHRPVRMPSLKAPYWVKKVPKTPRTMRTERRQGWGGSWDVAGIEQFDKLGFGEGVRGVLVGN